MPARSAKPERKRPASGVAPFAADDLLSCIRRLSPAGPISKTLEEKRKVVWYRTQKEHWLGWLREYDGPGYYCRKRWDRDARFIYNHIMCPPMLMWLAEAAGVSRVNLMNARRRVVESRTLAAKCASFREQIPWDLVAARIGRRPSQGVTRLQ